VKRVFGNWWVLTIAAAVLVALVLAVGLPLVAPPLRPWWVRLLLLLAVVLVWGVFALLRVMKARKAAKAIADELASSEAGAGEEATLNERMRQALSGLKSASGDKRDYLYNRPWYVIIGPPGAGKTTALLSSGVRFPFSETALKGVGGTRNLDFWFADEAVLVDTAGRYTTQDSDETADARGWQGFLKLLRKHRPLQPVNGVLVAIGLDEILTCDRAGLDAHAAAVRRRLAELQRTLEVAVPVYVLFTKADLLAGFAEYFEDLDVEGRRAVLGATLPWPPQPPTSERLTGEFDVLAQAVQDRMSKRLQDEADPRRRSLILGFPAQLAGVRARAMRFLGGAFPTETATAAPLRGFYFTSGVQGGAPLDRILAGVAGAYSAGAAPPAGKGRAYFLNRLLGEVVFPEAGLVQGDPKSVARRRAALTAAFAVLGVVVLLAAAAWTVSFLKNGTLQNQLLAGAQAASQETRATGVDLVQVRETDPSLEQTLSILRALRELPRGYADQAKAPPLLMRMGLYQDAHAQKARDAYLEAVQRILLPRVLLRLESYLHEHLNDPLAIYEPLKVYLMLGGQGPPSGDGLSTPADPKAIKAWVENDWETASIAGADAASVRKELDQHLDALLGDPQFGRVWPERQAALDSDLINSARAAVQTLSLADRAYAILRQKAAASGGADWRADAVLGVGDAQAFANGPAVMQATVPYFFTRTGYERAYQIGLQTVQSDLERDLWVMGPDVDKATIRTQVEAVRPGVAQLYAKEYIAAWDGVMKTLQPGDYFHNLAALGAVTRAPSPLKLVLLELRKNTTFTGGASGAAATAAKGVAAKLGAMVPGASALGGGAAGGGGTGLDAGRQITDYFKTLQDYVGDGKAPGALDDFLTALKSAGAAMNAAGVAGGGLGGAAAQGQVAQALGAVTTAAAMAPAQMQSFVGAAAKGGQGAAVSSAQGAIADEYQRNLLPACRGVTENRYPFFGAAQSDAAAADILRVMGANGQFDSFVRDRLGPLLETSGPVWRWRRDDPVGALLDPTSAEQFQKASQIRDLLTSGLPLKVELAGLGGAVTAVEFSAGGATYRFETAAPGAKPVIWSMSAGLPEAHVVLFSGTQEVKRFAAEGAWAPFRLFDAAQRENAGPMAFKATFGQGAQFATLRVTLPTDKSPFGRGGMWSFRCPAKL
jgi:type VI secretion system protein ImpL